MKEHDIDSYIKLQSHEKRKTRAYKNDIGKHYNMEYIAQGDNGYYLCKDGRKLEYIRIESKKQDSIIVPQKK